MIGFADNIIFTHICNNNNKWKCLSTLTGYTAFARSENIIYHIIRDCFVLYAKRKQSIVDSIEIQLLLYVKDKYDKQRIRKKLEKIGRIMTTRYAFLRRQANA